MAPISICAVSLSIFKAGVQRTAPNPYVLFGLVCGNICARRSGAQGMAPAFYNITRLPAFYVTVPELSGVGVEMCAAHGASIGSRPLAFP